MSDIPAPTTSVAARDLLSDLLEQLLARMPGTQRAVLAAADGIKIAWSHQSTDDADNLAAVVTGMYALGRQAFKESPGRTKQVVAEHESAGLIFAMSGGEQFASDHSIGTVLAVVTARDADAGQVGYEMESFLRGLDEHLVVTARGGTVTWSTLP